MKKQDMVLDVRDMPKAGNWLILSLQHLFAMFGATILVPFLTEMSQGVALISSGVGTLAYLLITRGRVPAYLGSSFAFIAPISMASQISGLPGAMIGSFLAGLVYGVVALLITMFGLDWLKKVLPPVVVGPVIMVIGLGLASTAVGMAMNDADGNYSGTLLTVALMTLGITILAAIFFKGFFGLIPILFGIIGGYLISFGFGIVDTSGMKAEWNEIISSGSFIELLGAIFSAPEFLVPFVHYQPFEVINFSIVMIMVPIAVVTIMEHTGDQMVLSKVVGRNFLQNPGLNRSILGDGIATMIASVLGGPPNTTYGENIGVLAITRVFSVFVIAGAAIIAILFGFTGIFVAIIEAIPGAVMGGVSILLFGIIASSGLRMLIDNEVDLGDKRNLIISSVILVIGVGGMILQFELKDTTITVSSMALAATIGIILNLILPGREKAYGNGKMFETEPEGEADHDPAA
ncbi:uracil permease [Melghiribacillus thermohalophilus]|uniref:Uracil permease n=1 Tax=Melghiribacillus thermohalophilus TaxID=1324956 RepID=A0A4R3NDX7_9BACI|nr:solute carrier family 23 protein [Melghiribacillus thermohalophilus]TCT26845.1 uracil permease [Melghiribacillus thermohalophilus]